MCHSGTNASTFEPTDSLPASTVRALRAALNFSVENGTKRSSAAVIVEGLSGSRGMNSGNDGVPSDRERRKQWLALFQRNELPS